jgi:zinc transporter
MRKLAQKFDALDYEFSAIYERARLLQDEIAGRMTAITNRRLFTLSVLTACMLPSTLVTGFFGMNTKDMPLQNGDGGTWYASAGDRRGSTDLVAAQADQGAVGRVRPWWWVGEA